MNNIYPIKNYHGESMTECSTDILALHAFYDMMDKAQDYIWTKNPTSTPTPVMAFVD